LIVDGVHYIVTSGLLLCVVWLLVGG